MLEKPMEHRLELTNKCFVFYIVILNPVTQVVG